MNWLFSPKVAAYVAAFLLGRVDVAPDLVRVCRRESRCRAVGIHIRDAHLSHRGWLGQVKLGHLDRKCQPERGCKGPSRVCRERWASRGAFGLSAASHWQFMGPCYAPELFDKPFVSALVAARKYLAVCDGDGDGDGDGRGWCP